MTKDLHKLLELTKERMIEMKNDYESGRVSISLNFFERTYQLNKRLYERAYEALYNKQPGELHGHF